MSTQTQSEAQSAPLQARIRAAASDLLSRAQLASRAGLSFLGKRDLYATLGYSRILTPRDFRERYERNGIAARVVDALPKGSWKGGGELVEDEDPDTLTPFEQEWDILNKRLGIWSTLCRADILAGLGRFSVVLIGAEGELDEPLPKKLPPEGILYLTPFSEEDVSDFTVEQEESSPRFGLPLVYDVRRISGRSPRATQATQSRKVHYSRILHIADGILDDRTFGIPRMKQVWNFLDDLEKVSGGGAEAFWMRAHQGMHIGFDADTHVGDDEAKAIKESVEDYVHGLKRFFSTQGAAVTSLGSDVANFSNPVDAIITLIAGATGIPKRILVGSERGELASSQDKTSWDDLIQDRRDGFVEPLVVRPLIDMFIKLGVLPEPEDYVVRWPEIEELDTQQKATVATAWAGLNTAAKKTVVTPNEIRDKVLGLNPFTPEEEAAQAEADAAAAGGAPPAEAAFDQVDSAQTDVRVAAGKALPLWGQKAWRFEERQAQQRLSVLRSKL